MKNDLSPSEEDIKKLNEICNICENKEIQQWKSLKVPESLHAVLRKMSVERKEFIYEIIAQLLSKEIERGLYNK